METQVINPVGAGKEYVRNYTQPLVNTTLIPGISNKLDLELVHDVVAKKNGSLVREMKELGSRVDESISNGDHPEDSLKISIDLANASLNHLNLAGHPVLGDVRNIMTDPQRSYNAAEGMESLRNDNILMYIFYIFLSMSDVASKVLQGDGDQVAAVVKPSQAVADWKDALVNLQGINFPITYNYTDQKGQQQTATIYGVQGLLAHVVNTDGSITSDPQFSQYTAQLKGLMDNFKNFDPAAWDASCKSGFLENSTKTDPFSDLANRFQGTIQQAMTALGMDGSSYVPLVFSASNQDDQYKKNLSSNVNGLGEAAAKASTLSNTYQLKITNDQTSLSNWYAQANKVLQTWSNICATIARQ